MRSIFPNIHTLDDLLPHIADRPEIKVMRGAHDTYIVCYMFADKDTFSNEWLRECRGIVFDRNRKIVGRPLHKFFNIGEREETMIDNLDLSLTVRVMDKRDGSMIHTVWMNDQLFLKSKKSFDSDVVKLAWDVLKANPDLHESCRVVAQMGYTAIFEVTSPFARIVLPHEKTELTILHIRDTTFGHYHNPEMFEMFSPKWTKYVDLFFPGDVAELLANVNTLRDVEGYVVQFDNGDMVKHKCEWYRNLHRSVTMLRERDIAQSVLDENLDDIKSALRELNIDFSQVEAIETEVVETLNNIRVTVETEVKKYKHLSRKDFALMFRTFPIFGLMIKEYLGEEPDYKGYYQKHKLKDRWSLNVLNGGVEDSDG